MSALRPVLSVEFRFSVLEALMYSIGNRSNGFLSWTPRYNPLQHTGLQRPAIATLS